MNTVKQITDALSTLSHEDLLQVNLAVRGLIDEHVAGLKFTSAKAKALNALTEGTMVDLVMENVSEYWDEDFMDAAQVLITERFPKKEKVIAGAFELAGDLSNDRDDLQRGKLDEEEEENWEQQCSKLQSSLERILEV